MKSYQSLILPLAGLAVFGASFVAGFGSRAMRAHAGTPSNLSAEDSAVDDNMTLPSDVRSRLSHIAATTIPQDFRPAVTFWEVLGKVKTRYVDKVTDQDKLTHGAIGSMLRSLRDPYSRIMSPDELQLDREQASGHFKGIGLVLGARLSGQRVPVQVSPGSTSQPGPPRRQNDPTDRVWQLVVLDAAPGSAAAAAHLQPGDVVSKIDGVRIDRPPLSSKTIDDLNLMLNGPSVQGALLTVLRPATNQTLDIHAEHGGEITEPAVEARMLPNGVAYVRIRLFTPACGAEFIKETSHLQPAHPTSLVLDLRDNPGGILSSGEQIIGALAPGGPAGLLDTHNGLEKLAAPAPSTPAPSFEHIVVLVNAGTAHVAEVVAGALHERKAAILAGAPTFGDGLVQTLYPLKDGWAYSLTTGRVRTPQGVDFNEHGLAVDRPMNPNLLEGDGAINAAIPYVIALKDQGK